MERSGRHPPKAATVVIRAELVSKETGSAFQPGGGCYTLATLTNAVMYGNENNTFKRFLALFEDSA